jgi:nucleotide-binding universal stress UspA family protein
MTYKSILVLVDDTARCAARLDVAFELAQAFGAHVTALAVTPDMVVPPSVQVSYGAELAAAHARAVRETLDPVKAGFLQQAARAGVTSTEWREAGGNAVATAALHARYADLLIVGQPGPDDTRSQPVRDFLEHLILSAGRPILVIPYAGKFTGIGTKALVAWNASREATRAVTDALPLLARAGSVAVLVIDPQDAGEIHGDAPGADVSLFLARHGVKAEAHPTASGKLAVGDVILSRASDIGADLIVMGAWGHSRVRELIMGGATRSLLEQMTVPVLLSH